ncbi:hypothetical protein LTR86_009468 [Recurvomyces mirabilis]|nr:hypothetical protein LTR86_009468 [Recurvomyces mirabilis]
MTARWPSSCLQTGSSIFTSRYGFTQLATISRRSITRHYAQPPPRPTQQRPAKQDQAVVRIDEKSYAANSAFIWIQSGARSGPVNPPRSTLPPPLELPERKDIPNFFYYWFKIGSTYGSFYKEGVKAVWYNNKASRALRERIRNDGGGDDAATVAIQGRMSRSEWQLLARNTHDIGKLPLFGVLVLLFGEWLPLLVPFMPGVVPGTCRIPKQVRGMREKAEERRRVTFRMGNFEPEQAQIKYAEVKTWPMTETAYIDGLLQAMREDQLHHLSSSLTLHSRLWDRVQLYPLRFLMTRSLAKHLQYLAIDDRLLLHSGRTSTLTTAELERACEERGLDVLGRPEPYLRDNLSWWLKRQQDDEGRGRAMMSMLFRRPNAWIPGPNGEK